MGKIVQSEEGVLQYFTAGRGLGGTAAVVGLGLLAGCIGANGGLEHWNFWSLGIAALGGLLTAGGILLLVRGPQVWTFDRRGDRSLAQIHPPARSRVAPFALARAKAVVLTAPRGLGPSLLLLSLGDSVTHTLEVGGALERQSYRALGMQLSGFLGVPFEDQTRP